MNHPTKKQMQKVIDLMYSILPLTFERSYSLNMGCGAVNNCGYPCGTIHCFGGWFAVACLEAGLLTGRIGYEEGADMMATILGFENRKKIKQWAVRNPIIWGCENGYYMFSNEMAFSSQTRPSGALSVSDIINHLEEVMCRLPK